MIRSQKKNFRFDIWALYQLYENLTIEINKFQLSKSIMNKILDWERSKLKICRYTLDSNYRYRIVTDEDKIIIQHSWHNYLFDADYFSRITNNFISNQSIEYTLGNIFDTIVLYVMNNNVNLNNNLIFNMLIALILMQDLIVNILITSVKNVLILNLQIKYVHAFFCKTF